nr:hypothetical protein [Agrobacterium tumefaciens]
MEIGEASRGTIRVEHRDADGLARGLFNRAGTKELIVVGGRKSGADGVDLDIGVFKLRAFFVKEPVMLDMLMIRTVAASRSSGSIACVTAIAPNTSVSGGQHAKCLRCLQHIQPSIFLVNMGHQSYDGALIGNVKLDRSGIGANVSDAPYCRIEAA